MGGHFKIQLVLTEFNSTVPSVSRNYDVFCKILSSRTQSFPYNLIIWSTL